MISWAGWWTQTPSTTLLQPLKWNAHFLITFNFDDQLGWLMDLNPIHHPSPAKKMKCSFFDYVQLLMIGWAGKWTQNPSATPLQPIKWNASFWIVFTSDDKPGWLMDSNPICHPSPAKKWNAHFRIMFTSDDQLGWSMDLNPICQPSPANKMKCYFLDYVQLLMIGWAGRWTQTPSFTSLQPKKWNAHICIMFNF